MYVAVRKNRYVVLPADFEDAWKVRVIWRCLSCSHVHKFSFFPLPTTRRTSSVSTRRWTFVRLLHSLPLLVTELTLLDRPVIFVSSSWYVPPPLYVSHDALTRPTGLSIVYHWTMLFLFASYWGLIRVHSEKALSL